MKQLRTFRRGERGFAMAQTAIFLVALTGLVTVGVDIGRLAFTATEVQNMADVAATAAAVNLFKNGAGTARAGADALITRNYLEGRVGVSGSGGDVPDVVEGTVNSGTACTPGVTCEGTGCFTSGGTSAVCARATMNVQNTFAGIFGMPTSTVSRRAIASFTSLGGAGPQLPITICSNAFLTPNCTTAACLPSGLQTPSPTDNTAWTAFFQSASQNNVNGYIPSACGGDGNTIPQINVGDAININNGAQTPDLRGIASCLTQNPPIDTFLVPVINCTANLNQAQAVVGFATVHITAVDTQGSDKHITFDTVVNGSAPGTPGGQGFGSGFFILAG